MTDCAAGKPVRVLPDISGPYIRVSLVQLEKVRESRVIDALSVWLSTVSGVTGMLSLPSNRRTRLVTATFPAWPSSP